MKNYNAYDPKASHGSLGKTIAGKNPKAPLIVRANVGAMKLFFWGGLIVFGLLGGLVNLFSL